MPCTPKNRERQATKILELRRFTRSLNALYRLRRVLHGEGTGFDASEKRTASGVRPLGGKRKAPRPYPNLPHLARRIDAPNAVLSLYGSVRVSFAFCVPFYPPACLH